MPKDRYRYQRKNRKRDPAEGWMVPCEGTWSKDQYPVSWLVRLAFFELNIAKFKDSFFFPQEHIESSNWDLERSSWPSCLGFSIWDRVKKEEFLNPKVSEFRRAQMTAIQPAWSQCWEVLCEEADAIQVTWFSSDSHHGTYSLPTASGFFNGLRQDPLEAILVIFGRRALIFFAWKLLEKNEKWHYFCAHAQWWSPWRRKNVEKGHLALSNLTFLLKEIDTNGFRRMKEEGLIYKLCLNFFNFCLGT